MALWRTPKYRFRVPHGPDDGGFLKELGFDVTTSAPTFAEPSSGICQALKVALARLPKSARILDVGAGKLRNTLYLLQSTRNTKVWAVEYEGLREGSEQAAGLYAKALAFKTRFHPVVFPHQFIGLHGQFDLILLTNVITIMPVPAERFLLLEHCFRKARSNGRLLWHSQHKEPDYEPGGHRCNDQTRIGDGFHIKDVRYRSFYRDYYPDEVDQLMLVSGFTFEESITVPGHNFARLYKKKPPSFFASVLKRRDVEKVCANSDQIPEPKTTEIHLVETSGTIRPIVPNPPELDFESLCIKKLKTIPVGAKHATTFHRLSQVILSRVFQNELKNFRMEREINAGRKRVDIVARNYSTSGFFQRLDQHHDIRCPNVFIECKNYSRDPANPEFDQLAMRLAPHKGMFGILVHRKRTNILPCAKITAPSPENRRFNPDENGELHDSRCPSDDLSGMFEFLSSNT